MTVVVCTPYVDCKVKVTFLKFVAVICDICRKVCRNTVCSYENIVYNFVILMGLKTDYLKMLSAIIVALFLGIPYLKSKYFTKHKDLHPSDLTAKQTGGKGNA